MCLTSEALFTQPPLGGRSCRAGWASPLGVGGAPLPGAWGDSAHHHTHLIGLSNVRGRGQRTHRLTRVRITPSTQADCVSRGGMKSPPPCTAVQGGGSPPPLSAGGDPPPCHLIHSQVAHISGWGWHEVPLRDGGHAASVCSRPRLAIGVREPSLRTYRTGRIIQ